jgi:hypothetical protein
MPCVSNLALHTKQGQGNILVFLIGELIGEVESAIVGHGPYGGFAYEASIFV